MKRNASSVVTLLITLLLTLWLAGSAGASPDKPVLEPLAPAAGAPTIVSYQGQVTVGGTTYNGTGYFKFAVVDDGGGVQWSNAPMSGGQPNAAVSLSVASGLFSVLLGDTSLTNMAALPATAFSDTARSLRVWFSSDGATFTLLTPDRRLAAVPYAMQAEAARNNWSLAGNAGTTPGTHFLGTIDNVSLTLGVFNTGALRLEPNLFSPNVVGGNDDNTVTTGTVGAAIGGGGGSGSYAHRVTDDWGTVGGGWLNRAGDAAGTTADRVAATVGGGYQNTASGRASTVSGGQENTASGEYATITGGYQNAVSGERATVGGGSRNTASGNGAVVIGGNDNTAGALHSVVLGGTNNSTSGYLSLAAGRQAKANHPGAFVWADSTAADFSSTANDQFAVRASGGVVFSTGTAAVKVNNYTVWHAGNDGAGSTLDADLLDGYSPGNASGNLPLSNGTVNTNLNADLLDGQHASAFAPSTHTHEHGDLSGLGDDDHPQYFNLSQSETVSGIPAFNGGTTGGSPPFTVDSATQVTNLNADMLDGMDSTSFQEILRGACSPGYSFREIYPDGSYSCEKDDDTTYAAGNQLSLSAGNAFNVVEGTGSGLDADLLDGNHGDYYHPMIATSNASATTAIGASCTNYTWVTISVPRGGVVVVEANVRTQLSHVNGTKDELVLNLDTSSANCNSPYDEVRWTFTASYPTFSYEEYTFKVRRAFTVSAGANTFYLNGLMGSGAANDDRFWYASLHATFYPQ